MKQHFHSESKQFSDRNVGFYFTSRRYQLFSDSVAGLLKSGTRNALTYISFLCETENIDAI